MRRFFDTVLILFVCVHTHVFSSSEPQWGVVPGSHFELVGLDRRSLNFVESLNEQLLEVCERHLMQHPEAFPQRVLVTFRVEDTATFSGAYQIVTGPGGFVRIDFRWDESLTYWQLCYGLVDAYLTRYTIYNYGYESLPQVKAWVVAALSSELYLGLRPSAFIGWADELGRQETPDGPSLTDSAIEVRGEPLARSPYLLLQAMRKWGISRSEIARMCELGVAGNDIQQVLEASIQPTDPNLGALTLHDWWIGSMDDLLDVGFGVSESLEQSRAWLTDLADFTSVREFGVEVDNLRGLWKHRENSELRDVLRARIQLIRMRLEQVNPAYFNAAVGLGALYEQVLEAEQFHTFIYALTTYLSEFVDAKRLHAEVSSALRQ